MMGLGMGIGTLGVILFLFFLVVIIGLAILLLSGLFPRMKDGERSYRSSGRGEAPMEILKRRYAAGEISKEEFAEMREELRKG